MDQRAGFAFSRNQSRGETLDHNRFAYSWLLVTQAVGNCGGARVEREERSSFVGADVREAVS